MSDQLDLFADSDHPLMKAFLIHHARNPHVYAAFERFALETARRHDHYSALGLIHVVRWHSTTRESESQFKVNNNWAPFYARIFESNHPELSGFFELRRARADRLVA